MLFNLALRRLRHDIHRTIGMLLIIAMGCGSLFILSGMEQGVINQYRENRISDGLRSQILLIQMALFAIVFLVVFNAVLRTVMERKREIGNLRANGESVAGIVALLMYEGLALGCLGSLSGILVAFSLSKIFFRDGILMPLVRESSPQFYVMLEFEPVMGLAAFVWVVCIVVAATLFAASRVCRTSIADSFNTR